MAAPTIGARLARRLIVFTADPAFVEAVERALPGGWSITPARTAAQVGPFQEVLLHRFALLDLAPAQDYDPLAAVRAVRSEMNLNLPIFCFGGDQAARDAARIARADRFFGRDELEAMLPKFCESYAW